MVEYEPEPSDFRCDPYTNVPQPLPNMARFLRGVGMS